MKRIISYISMVIISILILLINTNVYAASSAKIESNLKQSNFEDGKVQIEVSIKEIENVGEGINAYSGILNFDSKELELVELKGTEEWNMPTYNENTLKEGKSKIVATANKFTNEKGVLFTAIFEKKVEKQNYNVEFTELEVAAKVNGETVKVTESKEIETEETNIKSIESQKREVSIKEKVGYVLGIIVASILLFIGVLTIGFGVYRKNKGGK